MARVDLTEAAEQTLNNIDSGLYLVQFDVSESVYFLLDIKTKTQYNMPLGVQRELDSRYWKDRDPTYWTANFGP